MTSYAIISSTTAWFFLMWWKWVSTDVVQPKYLLFQLSSRLMVTITSSSVSGTSFIETPIHFDVFSRQTLLYIIAIEGLFGFYGKLSCQRETRLKINWVRGSLNQQVFSVHFTWCVSPSTGGMTTAHCADWKRTLPPPSETNTLHYSQESLFVIKY